ncbi:BgTH12-05609 [Blumeria graminis f. sp. triticale]|uniref:BgTH12-01899 n=1 Tax=Blumeria graminis f. sp. triticale TaxID=1689686 RepID=A0A9W4CUX8_BLUGR|nr:BgTH12-04870 [Blumeria graminis f. sp. triticale]CAD6499229.1 BgTH12-04880 [Blumeria graminis f. sp. triticale]CAD6501649.1 BgTH12-01899 [Blumeria graminis f. sp. triticale]CAD6502554.1 BgTH12-05145 [Blumeria graminis f. sp. triticale]CAD6502806.1 BgTH12-05396 [Blumeria graminis f. sp. triticale]
MRSTTSMTEGSLFP